MKQKPPSATALNRRIKELERQVRHHAWKEEEANRLRAEAEARVQMARDALRHFAWELRTVTSLETRQHADLEQAIADVRVHIPAVMNAIKQARKDLQAEQRIIFSTRARAELAVSEAELVANKAQINEMRLRLALIEMAERTGRDLMAELAQALGRPYTLLGAVPAATP